MIDPCIPKSWPGFEITFQYHSAHYDIAVRNPHGAGHGVSSITFDSNMRPPGETLIPSSDDGATHKVEIVLGS